MHLLVTLLLAAAAAGCGRETDAGQYVVDPRALLSDAERARLAAYHRGLRDDNDVDYRVVIDEVGADVDAYANARFRQLGVGRGSRGGRGLLLVIDPVGNRVRLEVGGRLEGVITDAFTGYVEREQMVPFFREHRIADGVLATTELLVQQLAADPTAAGGSRTDSFAAGAGASRAAEIGAGRDEANRHGENVAATDSPEATVARYFDAMAAHNSNPDLELYSRASRALLSTLPITPAQMDNVAREGRRCPWQTPRLDVAQARAVVRAAPAARGCAPYLLVREEGLWRLDLQAMYTAIRFGRDNAWRFGAAPPAAYAFAFGDWAFDANGYPVAR